MRDATISGATPPTYAPPTRTAREEENPTSSEPVDHADVKALQRFSGYIPGGSIGEIMYGLKEVKGKGAQGDGPHHVKDGVIDITKGVNGTLSLVDHIPIYIAAGAGVMHAATPAIVAAALPTATMIAGPLGVIGGALDGGRDVYEGVKDHNTKQAVIGGVKLTSAALGTVGAVTVNPILLGASGALYLGAVVVQNWQGIKDGAHMLKDKMGHVVGLVFDRSEDVEDALKSGAIAAEQPEAAKG